MGNRLSNVLAALIKLSATFFPSELEQNVLNKCLQ